MILHLLKKVSVRFLYRHNFNTLYLGILTIKVSSLALFKIYSLIYGSSNFIVNVPKYELLNLYLFKKNS